MITFARLRNAWAKLRLRDGDRLGSSKARSNGITGHRIVTESIRQVLEAVVRDEAAVVDELCSLLTRCYENNDVTLLPAIIDLIGGWQNRPPECILRGLKTIRGESAQEDACRLGSSDTAELVLKSNRRTTH
jgi:hypothetical protein